MIKMLTKREVKAVDGCISMTNVTAVFMSVLPCVPVSNIYASFAKNMLGENTARQVARLSLGACSFINICNIYPLYKEEVDSIAVSIICSTILGYVTICFSLMLRNMRR